jgi:hypothetical protein
MHDPPLVGTTKRSRNAANATANTLGPPMRRLVTSAIFCLAITAVGAASAESRPGTFLIAEGGAGFSVGDAFAESPSGYATRLTFGGGGKFVNFPTRFYGVVNLTLAGYSGTVGSGALQAETDRSWFAWSAGLRTLTPIARNLRVLFELSMGRASVSSEAVLGGGRERFKTEDASFLVEVGAGIQYRFAYRFSIGIRADLAIPTSLDEFDVLAELAGAKSGSAGSMNPSALATLTLHL